MTKETLLMTSALFCGTVIAASVGDSTTYVIDVDDRATLSTPIRQSAYARIYKTGPGTLEVQQAALTNSPVHVEVLGGKVAYAAGGEDCGWTDPPDAASKSALWLDASQTATLHLEGGSAAAEPGDVTAAQGIGFWNDRRDGAASDGRTRPFGAAATAVGMDDAGLPQFYVTNGLPVVDFGGRTSGKFLDIRGADGAQTSFNQCVTHSFFVYGFIREWGYLLGKRSGDSSWYLSGVRNTTYMTRMNDCRLSPSAAAYQAATFLNGRCVDWTTERSPQGFNLIWQNFEDSLGTMNAVYATKANESSSFVGGDYLCEALVFTNVLSEAELAEVEDYLLSKWNLLRRGRSTGRNVQAYTLASGTAYEADVEASSSTPPVSFAGSGTIVKKGAGNLAVGPSLDDDFTGSLELHAGGVLSQGGRLPPVQAKGADVYSAAACDPQSGALRDENGVLLTRSDGVAGRFSKTGRGDVRVNAIADDVKAVDVEAGTLILEAPAAADPIAPVAGDVEVEIANFGFELPAGHGTWLQFAETNGWWQFWNQTAYVLRDDFCSWDAPQGTQMIRLTRLSDAYTKITVPAAGTYEFSFRHSARTWKANEWGRSNVDIVFAPVSGYSRDEFAQFPVVATFIAQAVCFPRTAFRVKVEEPGDYHLGFRVRNLDIDNYVYLDDLRFDYVADAPRTDVWPIPNGDFELIPEGVKSYIAYTNVNTSGEGALAEGWTFSQDLSADKVAVGLVRHESFGNSAGHSNLMLGSDPKAKGAAQLLIYGNLGTAATTFTPPAGRWRLQALLARNAHKNTTSSCPGIEAVVTVGGESVSLGVVSNAAHRLRRRRWPRTFVTDGLQPVTLSLTGASATDCVASDDYVLVAENAGGDRDEEELLLNGDFESGGSGQGWRLANASSDTALGKHHSWGMLAYPNSNYAPTGYNGEWGVRLQQSGGVSQSVFIRESGTYRLRFAMAPRPGIWFGFNSVRAWLRDGTGSTEELGLAVTVSDSWQEYVFTFDVDEPGQYTIGVNGVGYPDCVDIGKYGDMSKCDHTCCVDGFSLKRVRCPRLATPALGTAKPRVSVAEGAWLRLDFRGTLKVSGLKLGDRVIPAGRVTADDYPGYLSGRGTLEIEPEGMIITVK